MNILGISAFYHDSAAALVQNGQIKAAAQEERFSRIKNDAGFPVQAIRFCLDFSNLSLSEIDLIVFYDKPLLKFERLLETYYAFAPRGFRSFLTAMPVWAKEKLFLKKVLREEFRKIDETSKIDDGKIIFTEHHLAHAASAFFPSGFEEAAILTIDGVGEWATTSFSHGKQNQITVLQELHFPHSVGLLYSAFTYFLGFKVNSGEYKLMGLAPYGNPEDQETKRFAELIKTELLDLKEDGSLWLNQDFFAYTTSLKMLPAAKWERLFGFAIREPESELTQQHCNLALAIQQVIEEIIICMAREAKRLTKSQNLCLAGGVALNCVATGKLLKENIFQNVFTQPAAGDSGGALGAALAAWHIYQAKPRTVQAPDAMAGSYLGPEFSDEQIRLALSKTKAVFSHFPDLEALTTKVASLLAEGNIVGWFQGRLEFGPRALGNRSILADARNPEMQKKLNLQIKFREGFRPFAPAVLAEDVSEYFEWNSPSPYMLQVHPVNSKHRRPVPFNYAALPLKEKLYWQRSDIPAVTHIDYSARIQTVHRETNYRFWQLLQAFKAKTGYSLLVNTSFNVRGEPVVCTPEEAYLCFCRTHMDYLAMGNFLFSKHNQPTHETIYPAATVLD